MIDTLRAHWVSFIDASYLVSGPALAMGLFLLGFTLLILLAQYLNLRRENRIYQLELGLNTRIDEKNYELNERLQRLNEQIRDMADEIDPSLSMFEQCAEALVMICNRRILDMNRSALSLFGYADKEECMDMDLDDFFDQSGRGQAGFSFDSTVREIRENGRARFKIPFVRSDGEVFQGDTMVSRISRCGQHIYLLGIREPARDEDALVKEREDALRASKAKSRFIATLSHEIRTPLNAIMGMSELLMDTGLSDEQADLLATVDQEASFIVSLINDILDFSKIEAGKLELETIDFNVVVMMESLARSFRLRAEKKNLDFHLYLSPDIPIHLKGDPGKLRQIMVNLLGNALKFTHKGDISVSVEPVAQEDGRVTLLFKVSDTGIGISKDKLAVIFEGFTQAEPATRGYYGGTGLGTTIARQLAELMGGQMDVVSSRGLGTTFSFTACFGFRSSYVVSQGACRIDGMKILVAGPSENNRKLIRHHLKYQGCRLDEAPSGKEALSLIDWSRSCDTPYDVIILAFDTIGEDSLDFSGRIQTHPGAGGTPLLAVTASGSRGDARVCRAHGIGGYLSWPVRQKDMIRSLESLAARPGNEDSETRPPLVTRYSIREDYNSDFTILLAEDYPTLQRLTLSHLMSAGYKAILAENGIQAVELYQSHGVDLVLMDVGMPEMDGIKATRVIRDLEKEQGLSPVPIIALTANAMDEDTRRCIDSGMDHYLMKPLKREELLEQVDRIAMFNWKRKMGLRVPEDVTTVLLGPREHAGSASILLVEDTPINQRIISQHLVSEGYAVDVADHGKAGAAMFREGDYDLVIMDLQMPVMDGFECAREIRAIQKKNKNRKKKAPIIAVTASQETDLRRKCREAGMDDFERKPIKRNRLMALVRFWLGEADRPEAEEEEVAGSPMDYHKALSEFQNDKDLLDGLLKEFLGHVRGQIDHMASAIEEKDPATLARTAHSIKGGASNILARGLSTAASHLEEIGKSGDLERAQEAVHRLEEEYQRLLQYTGTLDDSFISGC